MTVEDVALHIQQAQDKLQRQDYPGAIASFSAALHAEPANADIYRARGWVYYMQRSLPEALVDFSQALALQPENADIYTERGMAHLRAGDHEAAIYDFNE